MNNETPIQPAAVEPVPSGATGPRTEAGKAVSSQNARKHDLCSRPLRLSPEEWDEYNDMRARYACDLQPADDIEQILIDEICFNYWRLQQARNAEFGVILKHPTELHLIALYIRYRTSYERAFYKALDQIQKRQRDRRKQALSSLPVRSAESESNPAAAALPATPLAAVPLTAVSLAAVRSVDSASAEIQSLTRQLEQHIAESRVRSADSSAPAGLPKALADRLDGFVSQHLDALPQSLVEILKRVA
jgi:hypothetical protein